MFGLMRRAGRLPYCGTCKTLGRIYGQRNRVLLNHDTVFLAELLLHYAEEPQWADSYQSFNCLSLPREREIPPALEYAASATVVLAHFHIEDQKLDSRASMWRFLSKMLSPAYRKAAARLSASGFPLATLERTLATQSQREREPVSLQDLAEPTATATALVFEHGASFAGHADLQRTFHTFGHRFGFLAYLLDAYEDRDRDQKRGDFNAFAAFPDLDAQAEVRVAAQAAAKGLPELLGKRLLANVNERIGGFRVLSACTHRKPLGERWSDATHFARTMREREHAIAIKGAAVFATVAAIAFLFPHQARLAGSWRQCLGLGMNLMAISALMASSLPPVDPAAAASKAGKSSKGGGCCGSLDCDGCDCCDCGCPCDGCDCG